MLTFNIFTTVEKKLKQLYLKYLQNRIDSKVTSLSWVWRRSCAKKKEGKTISYSHFLQLFAFLQYGRPCGNLLGNSSFELWFSVCAYYEKGKRNFSGEYHKARIWKTRRTSWTDVLKGQITCFLWKGENCWQIHEHVIRANRELTIAELQKTILHRGQCQK